MSTATGRFKKVDNKALETYFSSALEYMVHKVEHHPDVGAWCSCGLVIHDEISGRCTQWEYTPPSELCGMSEHSMEVGILTVVLQVETSSFKVRMCASPGGIRHRLKELIRRIRRGEEGAIYRQMAAVTNAKLPTTKSPKFSQKTAEALLDDDDKEQGLSNYTTYLAAHGRP